jgi:TRAP-type mannitol/chloroaromatic compound transport system permease large subunit
VVAAFAMLIADHLPTRALTSSFGFALFHLNSEAPKQVEVERTELGCTPLGLLPLTGLAPAIPSPAGLRRSHAHDAI